MEAAGKHDEDTLAYGITPPPAILVCSTYCLRDERAGSVECSSERRNQISCILLIWSTNQHEHDIREGMYVYAWWSHRLIN
jgi:hypothetical protein